ncbi:ammonium transporter [Flammeovirga pacifica]|uniref:Ammonium transporter n=1 Tax=Flammeovirga pacifica TaxID=915059 RepID=A0A1S1Z4L9_FLAPC|nr:ammonium transporter [Flammeovirga pacifica]OHX68234.1 ammonia channel protein [Flammeovirga pacifica]
MISLKSFNAKSVALLLSVLLIPTLGFSADTSALNSGDTAWMLIATALVMLMTPAGLTLFYGGLAQRKTVLNTIGMSYTAFCTGTLVWVIIGYSLAFGKGNAYIGDFTSFLLADVKITDVEGSIPRILFIMFQGTFAAIAVALVSGAIIERVKYSTWIIFSVLWVALVYSPIAHWVWGGGFLSQDGELDFAGGTVIHINAGVSGLVLALMLGKRLAKDEHTNKPSSIKLMVLGSALLWFGWFGFNGGSQLAADFVAANAMMVTNVAAAAGGMAWLLMEWLTMEKKPTLLGSASGVISGLVGITPASGYVDVSGALAIGLISGAVGFWGVIKLKEKLGYDDTLDVFGIHGLVGIVGAVLTGVFANPEVNGAAGALYGNPGQVLVQLKAVFVTIIYSGVASFIIFKLTALITQGGRVTNKLEKEGIDEAFHGESSFDSM